MTDELTAYYPKRKALVGDEFKITIIGFNEDKEFVIADKLASLDAEQFAKLIEEGQEAVIGSEWSSVSVNQNSTDEDGAAQTWIKASYKLYTGLAKLPSTVNGGLKAAKLQFCLWMKFMQKLAQPLYLLQMLVQVYM